MPRRSTNIYKRKDGRWEARYVASIGINGKKKYASVYAKSYKEAREKQRHCLLTNHLVSNKEVITNLEELMWEWLGTTVNSVKNTTYQKYEGIIRNHIATELGQIPLKLVSSQMIDRYAFEKMNGSPKLSPKTVNDILALISSALSYAEQEYDLRKPKIRRVKEKRKEMRVLSISEQRILVNFLLNEMDLYKLLILSNVSANVILFSIVLAQKYFAFKSIMLFTFIF